MIIDARIVMGDNDLFLCNYEELRDVVDMFLVIECLKYFSSGNMRVPTFKYGSLPKVKYVQGTYDHAPDKLERERVMRADMFTDIVVANSKQYDVVSVLDGDEIIRKEAFIEASDMIDSGVFPIIEMLMPTSNFFANWLVPGQVHRWPKVTTAGKLRQLDGHNVRWWPHKYELPSILDSGWHCSHCGGMETFVSKCAEYGDDPGKMSEVYRYKVRLKETTFSSKTAEVKPMEWLPKSMQTPEMLSIFFRQ